jgi:uncharacterized protein YwgA
MTDKNKSIPQKWNLEDIFVTFPMISSLRILQDSIFIAQELGALEKKYNFVPISGTFALPYSFELERDVLELEEKGIIYQRVEK